MPTNELSVDQLRALVEVVRRARLFSKVAPPDSNIEMRQLMQVDIRFSLSDEQIERELLDALIGSRSQARETWQPIAAVMDEIGVEATIQTPDGYRTIPSSQLRDWASKLAAALPAAPSGSEEVILREENARLRQECTECGHKLHSGTCMYIVSGGPHEQPCGCVAGVNE